MKLIDKLKELGYREDTIKGFYIKEFKWTYIIIYVYEDNTLNEEWCGVQRKGLRKFVCVDQVRELCNTFVTFSNHMRLLSYEK